MSFPSLVRVATAQEAAALDADTIARGVPSRALMRVAGAHAATVIAARYGDRLAHGVTVYTGSGNNGGDGWVVAGALARSGVAVHVCDVVTALTADAVAEREAALAMVRLDEPRGGGVVIDALLGTGSAGTPRDAIGAAVRRINARREQGDPVIALDLPTGVDATTGACEESVHADLTITFGTCKRGHLLARGHCGTTVIVDIGLHVDAAADTAAASAFAASASLPVLVDDAWVAHHVPVIPFDAHKGTRKKITVVAGGAGMGGAGMLATDAALHSGVGMIQVVMDAANIAALQARSPEALTRTFPLDDATVDTLSAWSDAFLLGPGLPATDETRALIERLLRAFDGPVLLDAGALGVYDGRSDALATALRGRQAVITPHPAEFARLIGETVQTVLDRRFEIASDVARRLHATVLLKGTPTIVTTPDGLRFVSGAGTAALATAGSGDTLSGIVATLLAQTNDASVAAAAGAWIHGRAAELCDGVRGVGLDEIVAQLPTVWRALAQGCGTFTYPVLAELRSVADGV